mmetsp:Transcript_62704/g.116609  ORF Transcript_62704/g.116609 Transcript_62704/m.116609 type:complete len:459 (+) Transcript_62704:76-1452(+)
MYSPCRVLTAFWWLSMLCGVGKACEEGVTGDDCDRCVVGYKDFPHCVSCQVKDVMVMKEHAGYAQLTTQQQDVCSLFALGVIEGGPWFGRGLEEGKEWQQSDCSEFEITMFSNLADLMNTDLSRIPYNTLQDVELLASCSFEEDCREKSWRYKAMTLASAMVDLARLNHADFVVTVYAWLVFFLRMVAAAVWSASDEDEEGGVAWFSFHLWHHLALVDLFLVYLDLCLQGKVLVIGLNPTLQDVPDQLIDAECLSPGGNYALVDFRSALESMRVLGWIEVVIACIAFLSTASKYREERHKAPRVLRWPCWMAVELLLLSLDSAMSFAELQLTMDAKKEMDVIFHTLKTDSTVDGVSWKVGLPELRILSDWSMFEASQQAGHDSCYLFCSGRAPDPFPENSIRFTSNPLTYWELRFYVTPLLLLMLTQFMHTPCKQCLGVVDKGLDSVAPETALEGVVP